MDTTTRTFGIEIETHIPRRYSADFPAGDAHRGLQIPSFPPGWTGQRDGSIGRAGWHSVEVVSPVLKGEDGLEQVVFVAGRLAELGAEPNSQCGLHCHVGVGDFSLADLDNLRVAFIKYERAFIALSGNMTAFRVNNPYCRQSDRWSGHGWDDRYQTLNFTNAVAAHRGLRIKNTVEVRCWASTTSDATVVAAVSMAVALVSKVKAEGRPTETAQITDPAKALRQFVRDHFTGTQYRIVPDAPIGDVVLHAWHEVRRARGL